jgi:hypothetical protein
MEVSGGDLLIRMMMNEVEGTEDLGFSSQSADIGVFLAILGEVRHEDVLPPTSPGIKEEAKLGEDAARYPLPRHDDAI